MSEKAAPRHLQLHCLTRAILDSEGQELTLLILHGVEFEYMLGTTQADQKVSRVLSGWKPKDGARLPPLAALDPPVLARARKMQRLLFSNTMGFADTALNLNDDVADVLTATLFMHLPDMLRLCEGSPFVTKVREILAELNIGESELFAWSVTITRAFVTPPATAASAADDVEEKHSPALVDLIKRQSEQIDVLILQNKRLDERMLTVESQLRTLTKTPAADSACSDMSLTVAEHPSPLATKATRSKKKGAQSLSAIWFEWFTAEPCVYASKSVKKDSIVRVQTHYGIPDALLTHGLRVGHFITSITGYLMLFLLMGFALDTSSPAYKSEVLELGDKAQQNVRAFLKSHGSSAVAAGTALKSLRQMQKLGKLDNLIAQFHERVGRGAVVDPTPTAALPAFIRLKPAQS